MFKGFFSYKTTIVTLIVSLCIIILAYTPARYYSLNYIQVILNPFLDLNNSLSHSFSNFIALYLERQDLAKINQKLRHELIGVYKQNVKLKSFQQENKILKKELKFVDAYDYGHLMARVIGHGADYSDTQLIINKGSSDGLRVGLAVTANQGILIGKIIQLKAHLAYIKLLTDNQSKFSVNVMGDKSALGFLHGDHDLNLKVEFLPKDIQLKQNDLVVTSGMDFNIPAGLLVGKIYNLSKSEGKLWQAAYVEPFLDYQSIYLVDIILPTSP